MHAIQGKLNHAIEKARASVNAEQANLNILIETQEELQKLAALKEEMATQLDVFAFFAEQMPEPQIGQPDWHGMAKSARKLTKTEAPPLWQKLENEWWVVSTILTTGALLLKCKVTGKAGYVKDPTKGEWATAFTAPTHPYLWHDHSRVT